LFLLVEIAARRFEPFGGVGIGTVALIVAAVDGFVRTMRTLWDTIKTEPGREGFGRSVRPSASWTTVAAQLF
jgi:hypothetical protein